MTQIFFASNTPSVEHALSEVLSVLRADGNIGAIVLAHRDHLESMDKALWQKPQLAFMPHAMLNDPEAIAMPYILTHSTELENLPPQASQILYHPRNVSSTLKDAVLCEPIVRPLLINIGGDPLPIFARFNALLELIPSAEHPNHNGFSSISQSIQDGRLRYRHYRDRGYVLEHVTTNQSFASAFAAWWRKVSPS